MGIIQGQIFRSRRRNGGFTSPSRGLQNRLSRLETLEDRALLSVSGAEYDAIRAAYPDLDLPESLESINAVDLPAENLTVESLQQAIAAAGETVEDDLLVVRTSDSAHTLVLDGNPIRVSVDSERFGSLAIVAFSSAETNVPLTVDTQGFSRAMALSSSDVKLANVEILGTPWPFCEGDAYNGMIRLHRSTLTSVNVTFSETQPSADGAIDAICDFENGVEENYASDGDATYGIPAIADSAPYGGSYFDGSLYMLGDVRVTLVLMESDGTNDVNQTDWTVTQINAIKTSVRQGLDWWECLFDKRFPDSRMDLTFTVDYQYATAPFETSYEPISRDHNAESLWVGEFLTHEGYAGSYSSAQSHLTNMRQFNERVRTEKGADWAFSIFVVNSRDPAGVRVNSGKFTDGYFAYTWRGGPNMVLTYDCNGWTISRMPIVVAHETAHAFWALDEYKTGGVSYASRSGYYNVQNYNCEGNPAPGFVQQPSILASSMTQLTAFSNLLCSDSAIETVGWRDSDGDFIMDALDLNLTLTAAEGVYDADAATYSFSATSRPVALENLIGSYSTGNDVTLNSVDALEYRIDGGEWIAAARYKEIGPVSVAGVASVADLAPGRHSAEWRTVCYRSGVASEIFFDYFVVPGATLDAPVLSAESASDSSLLVSIGPVEYAESYVLEYSTDETFAISEALATAESSVTVEALLAGTVYYLRVKAVADGFNDSEWSDVVSVATDPTPTKTLTVSISAADPKYNRLIKAAADPPDADVRYQWYRSDSSDSWTAIVGAVGANYLPQAADVGRYLKVVASGTGDYEGIVAEAVTETATTRALVSVTLSGKVRYNTLITSYISPGSATATYQWYRGSSDSGWTAIDGATSQKYLPKTDDVGLYLKVVATGSGFYTGAVERVTASRVARPLVSVSLTSVVKMGTKIRSFVSPGVADATYQWYRCESKSGAFEPIAGATSDAYIPTTADRGFYLKVIATGIGDFYGSVSRVTARPTPGELAAPAVSCVADYGSAVVSWNASPGAERYSVAYKLATEPNYTVVTDVLGLEYTLANLTQGAEYTVRVKAIGGAGESIWSDPATVAVPAQTPLRSIVLTAYTRVGAKITSYVTPGNATATYQWYRGSRELGWFPIAGATGKSYTPTSQDETYYLKVVAVGYGDYVGEASKTTSGAVPSSDNGELGSETALLDEAFLRFEDDWFEGLAAELC